MTYTEQHQNTAAPASQMSHGHRLSKAEILSGITDFVRAWKTGHNEVTRVTRDGARIVRYRDTDILWVAPSGLAFRLDNGGVPLADVARHIEEALNRTFPPAWVLVAHPGYYTLMHPDVPHSGRFMRSLEGGWIATEGWRFTGDMP